MYKKDVTPILRRRKNILSTVLHVTSSLSGIRCDVRTEKSLLKYEIKLNLYIIYCTTNRKKTKNAKNVDVCGFSMFSKKTLKTCRYLRTNFPSPGEYDPTLSN